MWCGNCRNFFEPCSATILRDTSTPSTLRGSGAYREARPCNSLRVCATRERARALRLGRPRVSDRDGRVHRLVVELHHPPAAATVGEVDRGRSTGLYTRSVFAAKNGVALLPRLPLAALRRHAARPHSCRQRPGVDVLCRLDVGEFLRCPVFSRRCKLTSPFSLARFPPRLVLTMSLQTGPSASVWTAMVSCMSRTDSCAKF